MELPTSPSLFLLPLGFVRSFFFFQVVPAGSFLRDVSSLIDRFDWGSSPFRTFVF